MINTKELKETINKYENISIDGVVIFDIDFSIEEDKDYFTIVGRKNGIGVIRRVVTRSEEITRIKELDNNTLLININTLV